MQLMYVANRYERRPDITRWLAEGAVLVCDRYVASSIAYGEAQGLDPQWLTDVQRFLPQPDLTILLDIAPETAVQRKATGAIGTSATSPCSRACATATGVRRSRTAGSGSTASGRATRCRPTSLSAVATRLAPP